MRLSTLTIVGAIVAVVCLGLAAVLFVAEGTESTSRLALFFGLIGLVVPSLLALLKADQAAQQTNGTLDARMQAAAHRANAARRRGDRPETPAELAHASPVIPDPHDDEPL